MDSYNTRKNDVSLETPWSEWTWDDREYWYASRTGPTGVEEYAYRYPKPETRYAITRAPAPKAPNFEVAEYATGNSYKRDNQYVTGGDRATSMSIMSAYTISANSMCNSSSYPTKMNPFATEHHREGLLTNHGTLQSRSSSLPPQIPHGENPISFGGKIPPNNACYRGPTNPTNDSELWLKSDNMKNLDNTLSSMVISSVEPLEYSPITDTLDSRQPERFFTIGRIFMMLWTEPARQELHSNASSQLSTTYLGGKAFSEIRHFVVVANVGHGNTLCCPIHTYGGQGTLKPNLPDKEMHAAVYSHTGEPQLLPGEEMTIEPFPIIVEDPVAKIRPMSRINFSKIYTVEYYVRVCNVGRIEPSHINRFLEASPIKSPAARPRQNSQPTNKYHKPKKTYKDGHH
ncbi:hypothetical protein NHQ30_008967 [Ciborinia camelliae]|nr:hypothetical protein NHQ30_008967 [Ciborinia camelliae]